MRKKHEIVIPILNKNFLNDLIISLIYQGLAVYYNEEENLLCFTDDDGTMVNEIEDYQK